MHPDTKSLVIFLVFAGIGLLLHIISLSTPGWIILELPEALHRNGSNKWLYEAHSGLWETCRMEKSNHTDENEPKSSVCESLAMFQSRHNLSNHPEVDDGYLDYRITSAAFSIVGLILLICAMIFGIYSTINQRYMIKRVASLLFIMCAACVLVCIEVLMTSNAHAAARLPERVPAGSYLHYGYSFFLAWMVFVIELIVGCKFIISSAKLKGEDASSPEMAEANVPVELGR